MGAKKFGGAQGQKIAGNRGMSEKIVRSFLFHYPSLYLFINTVMGLRKQMWDDG
jgi:hypothetical protein